MRPPAIKGVPGRKYDLVRGESSLSPHENPIVGAWRDKAVRGVLSQVRSAQNLSVIANRLLQWVARGTLLHLRRVGRGTFGAFRRAKREKERPDEGALL